jgi:imidazolonepropionase-like amidohydrolase
MLKLGHLVQKLAAAALLTLAAAASQAADLAIVGGSIVDATETTAREDRTILIEEGRIARIGPSAEVQVPDGVPTIRAHGKWVIPGLVDAHVHFFQSGGLFTRPDVIDLRHIRPYAEEIQEIRETIETTLARYVAAGVTGVVDMGGPMWTFEVRERAARLEQAPRVAVAGPLLGTMVPPELQGLDDPPILHITNPDEARRALDMILEHDSDLLKVWFVRTGRLSAHLEWVRAVVEQAEEAGLPVVAHATQRRIAAAVVEAGVDILAHSVDDESIGGELLTEMAASNLIYVTTLMVAEGYRQVLTGNVHLSEIERRLGDQEVIASWERLPAPRPFPRPAVSAAEAENLRRVAAHGITIAAGSDAGNIGTLHGPALHRELELMVQAGLTPHQVLTAATLGGASAMGRAEDLGTVEEGRLADLVILDAHPLMDIRNTRAIHRVIKGGRVFDPWTCCH